MRDHGLCEQEADPTAGDGPDDGGAAGVGFEVIEQLAEQDGCDLGDHAKAVTLYGGCPGGGSFEMFRWDSGGGDIAKPFPQNFQRLRGP